MSGMNLYSVDILNAPKTKTKSYKKNAAGDSACCLMKKDSENGDCELDQFLDDATNTQSGSVESTWKEESLDDSDLNKKDLKGEKLIKRRILGLLKKEL